ncbi:hypothetical protein Acr_00g0074290 [Actinidia rufa]|uniref:Uncharacterized protein n=1 Tax=Actinidia rufa TaxID=165716 RepID=A0A7J0DSC3_9ERIC|nr:hypothetical protein Acr_00g0074290 [Actinidia rufa]
MSGNVNIRDVENTLPSWISNHLGECSYMDIEVVEYPSSPREDSPVNEEDPLLDTRPPLERRTNVMTQDELDHLRKSCSFPVGIQTRLPKADGTIAFNCLREVAFYEATFQASLHLPIHITLRRILSYYNGMTRSLPMDYLESLEFRGRGAPQGFSLDSGNMASSGEDNAKEKNIGNAAHVAANEGDSCLSRGDPPKVNMLDIARWTPGKGTSVNLGVILGLETSAQDNLTMAKKLFQGVVLPANKEIVSKLDLNMATTWFFYALSQLHEKEITEMRRIEALAKTSSIHEFKASDEYKEAMEGAASSYFRKGFDLCKKQINILHLDLDIHDLQIDPNLVDENMEEEKDVPDANLP